MTGRTLTTFALALVVATSVGAQESKPQANAPDLPIRQPQPVNIKVDLTITEQREGVAPTPKVITMLIADRDRGQMRSGGSGEQMLNVDARPEIVRDSRVRVHLTFDYRAPRTDTDKAPPMLTQSLASIVDDGKPVMVSQWTEPGSSRTIRVELKAAIQK